MQKERCFTGCLNQNKMSFPRNVVGNLPLSKLLLKEEKQRFFNGKVEDPRTLRAARHSGMTPSLMGFTLIELLVVVLIIGILAAVALPQYQKAVWKSRYVQAKTMGESLAQAEEIYYLANGEYTQDISALSIDVPATSCNSNNGICSFSWGYCALLRPYNFVRCYVYKNGAVYLEYERWLDSKARICATFSTNASSTSNQICKAETGLSSPSTTQDTRLLWNYF